MKMKDLKPGMAVAQRAASYNLTREPDRLIVLSTEYYDGRRWARASAKQVVFRVTADDDGAKYRVKAAVYLPGGGDKVKVLVLNTGNQRTEWLTPGQIEGPYVEIRDERAERRAAHEKAKRASRARRQAEIERMRAVQTGLAERGIILRPKDDAECGYSTDLIMTLADGEALLERLDEASSQFGDH